MGKQEVLTAVRAGSILIVLAAIAYQIYLSGDAGRFDPTRFFAYFTIQSNILTLIRGAIDGWYPYPFLDPGDGGYGPAPR